MANVELQKLEKSYGSVSIINGVDLTIQNKEFVVLVGPSGCGKTTILRMVAGLESISAGNILIDGVNVNQTAPKDRDIAMVFQNYALYPHMTVFDNMGFALKMRKTPKDAIRTRVLEAAKLLELEHLLERKPKALSGGQRQRVALGRAIVRNPKVFLMDEPLSNLDAKLRVQMRTEIQKLHRRLEATTIYVTHDQVEAMTMGDRIVVLNKGVIQQVGEPLEIYQKPANQFVGGFMGTMNFLKIKGHGHGQIQVAQELAWSLPAELAAKLSSFPEGDAIIVGIRPEHFQIQPQSADAVAIEITPDWIEVLGPETWVYFHIDGQMISASLPNESQPRVKEPQTLYLDLTKVSYFSALTEQNLLYQSDCQLVPA